jgi:hypothetical protein
MSMMQPLEMIKNEIAIHGVRGIVHSNYGEKMENNFTVDDCSSRPEETKEVLRNFKRVNMKLIWIIFGTK